MTSLEHRGLNGLGLKGSVLKQFVLCVVIWYRLSLLQVMVSVSFLTSQNLFVFTSVISDTIQRTDMDKWAPYQGKATAYFLGDSKSPYLFKNNHDPNIKKRPLGVWKTKVSTHSVNPNLFFQANWDPSSETIWTIWLKHFKWVCGGSNSPRFHSHLPSLLVVGSQANYLTPLGPFHHQQNSISKSTSLKG